MEKKYEVLIVFCISLAFFSLFKLPNYPVGSADELSYVYLTERISRGESLFMENELEGIPIKYFAPRLFVINHENLLVPFNQLGGPYIYSVFYRVLGNFSFFIINPFLASLGVVFAYLIGLEHFNKKTAILSSVFLTINPLYWNFAETMYTEVFSVVLVLAGVYFFLRFYKKDNNIMLVASAILLCYSVIVRYTNIIAVLAILLAVIVSRKTDFSVSRKAKSVVAYGITLILTIAVVLISNKMLYGGLLTTGYSLYEGANLQTSFSILYFIRNLPIYIVGLLIELPIISFFIVSSIKNLKNKRKMITYIALFLFSGHLIFYSAYYYFTIQIWNIVRYLIPSFPFLIILGSYYIFGKIKTHKAQKMMYIAIICLTFIIGFVQLGAFNYTAERSGKIGENIKSLTEDDAIIISGIYDKSIVPKIYANRRLFNPGMFLDIEIKEVKDYVDFFIEKGVPVYLLIDSGEGGITRIRTAPKNNVIGDGWDVRSITEKIKEGVIDDYNLENKEFIIEIAPFYPIKGISVKEHYEFYKISKKGKEHE